MSPNRPFVKLADLWQQDCRVKMVKYKFAAGATASFRRLSPVTAFTHCRNSYVDGPLPARPEQHLIGSLAIICPAFVGAIARDRWPGWVPRREVQTNWRPQGPLNFAECFASRIDRSHHLLFSCKFTHRRSTAALILCSPWQADLMPHGPELAMQRCPDRLGRWPSSSRQCGQSCWLALRQQASAVYA